MPLICQGIAIWALPSAALSAHTPAGLRLWPVSASIANAKFRCFILITDLFNLRRNYNPSAK